jgi:hypothetical protein
MQAFPAVSRPLRQTAIAMLLCLLAFSFAMEARMARYAPSEGFGSDAHSLRVMAPDARDLTPGENSSSAPESLAFLCVFLTAIAVEVILAPERRRWNAIRREALRISPKHYFSPQIAFRPPPVR